MMAGTRQGPLLKVVLLGDMGVGKTCLMRRLVHDVFHFHTLHTIGVDFLTKEITLDDITFTLQIWDTAGQEQFRSLRTPFYRGADVCMLAYSVVDKSTFDHLSYWKREFDLHAKPAEAFPFVVVGTKVDLASSNNMSRVPAAEAEKWCWEKGVGAHLFLETSSRTNEGVDEAFRRAVTAWTQRNASLLSTFSLSHAKLDLSCSDLVRIRANAKSKKKKCPC